MLTDRHNVTPPQRHTPPDEISTAPHPRRSVLSRHGAPRYSAIWIATALLFALSPLLASNSLKSAALLSMLPVAATLTIAAIGQTLVIQQRGLDLTVPGMILLSTVIITQHAGGANAGLAMGILLVIGACLLSGLLSGLAVTQFGITPLVATLGVNALLVGTVYQLTNGQATASSPTDLSSFASSKLLGVPATAVIALVGVAVVSTVIRTTVWGRRFVAVGASPPAAHIAGIRVKRYVIATYVVASLTYGAAGILLTGYLLTPGLSAGQTYLLPTIAAVVLGGTSLAGGGGSVVATAVGALFLTQLQQILTANGAAQSLEDVIQGSIIASGMLLRNVRWRPRSTAIQAKVSPTVSTSTPESDP
jgi:ribose transport system permease protein